MMLSRVAFVLVAIFATGGLAALATVQPAAAVAIILGGAFLLLTAIRPAIGLVAWLVVVAFVPDWTPISVGALSLKPSMVVGLPVLAGILLSRQRRGLHLRGPDFALAGALAVVLVLTMLENYPLFLIVNLALVLVLSYTLGRLAPDELKTAFVIVMVIVALWGIIEVITRQHIWATWAPSAFHHWGDIQGRAGWDRSEAGFGHSIAYGACVVMAIPFARNLTKHATLAQVILALGAIVSLSRGPMLALVLTFGLSAFAAVRGQRRVGTMVLFAMSMIGIAVAFNVLYADENAGDVQLSGEQRAIQLERAVPAIKWIGASAGVQVDQTGRLQSATVDVIDNTLLRLAANFGWIVAVLVLVPILYAVVRFVRREMTPASLALIGQIPVLAVTSLITQWQAILFLVAGLAITELSSLREGGPPPPRTQGTLAVTMRARLDGLARRSDRAPDEGATQVQRRSGPTAIR